MHIKLSEEWGYLNFGDKRWTDRFVGKTTNWSMILSVSWWLDKDLDHVTVGRI